MAKPRSGYTARLHSKGQAAWWPLTFLLEIKHGLGGSMIRAQRVEAGWVLVGVAHGAMKSSCAPKCGCLIMQQASKLVRGSCRTDDVAPLPPSFQVDASVPRSCCMCVQGVTSDFSLSARPQRSQRPEIHMDKRCMHMQEAMQCGVVLTVVHATRT